MSCDTASPFVRVALPYSRIESLLSRDMTGPIFDALRTAKLNQIVTRTDAFHRLTPFEKEHYCILHHELDHLRRQFCNTVGFLQLHLRDMLISVAALLLNASAESHRQIPFPLLGPILNSTLIRESSHNLATLRSACRGLDTTNIHAILGVCLLAADRGLELGCPAAVRGLCELGISSTHAQQTTLVSASRQELDEGVGAHHLYEHMAVLHELSVRCQFAANIDAWAEMCASDKRYRIIANYWQKYFPSIQHELLPTDLIAEPYTIYPIEFYAILDLALWIPYVPSGILPGFRWEDVQPGHRFVRLVHLLRAANSKSLTPVGSLSPNERNNHFEQIQGKLATLLGWPEPRTLARQWLDYFAAEGWADDCLLVRAKNGFTIAIMRKMLHERLASPFDTVCNNTKWVYGDGTLWFSHCVSTETNGSHCVNTVCNDDRNESTLQEHLVGRGIRKFLLGTVNDCVTNTSMHDMTNSIISDLFHFDMPMRTYLHTMSTGLFHSP